ncbi:MAG: DNA-binding transcriptional MocR family regulator [Arenicella sp.]|jgi:DNA-binding transcriptional MocR family regulator
MGSYVRDESRRKIVSLLERRDIPLIEDDVYGDLYFTEKRGTPTQCYSKKGLVLTCSSFSKTVAPGYRVGRLVSEKYGEKALQFKRAFSCSSSLLSQRTLSEFITSREYDRSIQNLRQICIAIKIVWL